MPPFAALNALRGTSFDISSASALVDREKVRAFFSTPEDARRVAVQLVAAQRPAIRARAAGRRRHPQTRTGGALRLVDYDSDVMASALIFTAGHWRVGR